jgi:hypothetical protein
MKKLALLAFGLFVFALTLTDAAQAQVFHIAPGAEVRVPINAGETITIICDGVPQIKMLHTGFTQRANADHVTVEQIDLVTGRWSTITEHVCAMNSAPGVLDCPADGLPQPVAATNNVYYYTLSNCCGKSGVREIMVIGF